MENTSKMFELNTLLDNREENLQCDTETLSESAIRIANEIQLLTQHREKEICPCCHKKLQSNYAHRAILTCCGTQTCKACEAHFFAEADGFKPHKQSSPCPSCKNIPYPKKKKHYLKRLKQNVKDNKPWACHIMARWYRHGNADLKIVQNRTKHFELMSKAAKAGYPSDINDLGSYYGMGVEGICKQSFSKSTKWFKKGAAVGHAGSLYTLGTLYIRGQGVKISTKMASELFQKSAALGNGSAMFNFATILLRESFHVTPLAANCRTLPIPTDVETIKRIELAVKYIRISAKANVPEAVAFQHSAQWMELKQLNMVPDSNDANHTIEDLKAGSYSIEDAEREGLEKIVKNQLRKKIIEQYEATGKTPTSDEIEQAVEIVFQKTGKDIMANPKMDHIKKDISDRFQGLKNKRDETMKTRNHACVFCGVTGEVNVPAKLRKIRLSKCSGCHTVSYCSTAHQKLHWKEHKVVCKAFQKEKKMKDAKKEAKKDAKKNAKKGKN